MTILFQKTGEVAYGSAEENQKINLLDPFGTPLSLSVNIPEDKVEMVAKAYDDRNSVVRNFPITLDTQSKIAFLQFFNEHIRRLAKDSYPEFVDLTEVSVGL